MTRFRFISRFAFAAAAISAGVAVAAPVSSGLAKRVQDLAKKKWAEQIQGSLPLVDLTQPGAIAWDTRLSDPFPAAWPATSPSLIFYAYARGSNRVQLKDGEYQGPAWARITTLNENDPSPEVSILTLQLKRIGVVKLRQLSEKDLDTLAIDPIEIFRNKRSVKSDARLKQYYCFVKKLGGIPPEAQAAHRNFMTWLACGKKN